MDWSNEVTMEFLDLYEATPVIWNPHHEHHKDRHRVHDAWKQIQSKLSVECSLKELKKKKENLMATYRKIALKIKIMNKRNADGVNGEYKPEWFAYDKLASFMHAVYRPRRKRIENKFDNLEDDSSKVMEETLSIASDPAESSAASEDDEKLDKSKTGTTAANQIVPPVDKRRKVEMATKEVEKRRVDLPFIIDKVPLKVSNNEISLFCELLCLKLRAMDDDTREIAMHEINNFMFYFKNSRRQQDQNYKQPVYFQSVVPQFQTVNQLLTPVNNSVSNVSPTQTQSASSTPQRDESGSEVKVTYTFGGRL